MFGRYWSDNNLLLNNENVVSLATLAIPFPSITPCFYDTAVGLFGEVRSMAGVVRSMVGEVRSITGVPSAR